MLQASNENIFLSVKSDQTALTADTQFVYQDVIINPDIKYAFAVKAVNVQGFSKFSMEKIKELKGIIHLLHANNIILMEHSSYYIPMHIDPRQLLELRDETQNFKLSLKTFLNLGEGYNKGQKRETLSMSRNQFIKQPVYEPVSCFLPVLFECLTRL